jgi:hypothetical protein
MLNEFMRQQATNEGKVSHLPYLSLPPSIHIEFFSLYPPVDHSKQRSRRHSLSGEEDWFKRNL